MATCKHIKANCVGQQKTDLSIPNQTEYKVHIVENEYMDGTYGLRGILVYAKNGRQVPGAKYKDGSAAGAYELPFRRENLFRRVVKTLPSKSTSSGRAKKAPQYKEGRYADVFKAIVDGRLPIPGWGTGTRTKAVPWFERHFLPLLETQFSADDVTVIGGPVLLKWKQDQRDETAKHLNSRNDLTITTTMASHYQQCNKIYKEMRKLDNTLPPIASEELLSSGARRVEVEQCKSVPEPIRQLFFRWLESNVESDPRKAFAATIVVDAGVRTSEGAAVIPSDIQRVEDLTLLPVLWQEQGGERNSVLKNTNSYRLVPLSRWGSTMLAKCVKHMGEIPTDPNHAPITSDVLSAWMIEGMKECGCTQAFLDNLENTLNLFPDKDESGVIDYTLTSYIWRRDYASRLQNYAALSPDAIDKLLGHKLSADKPLHEQLDTALIEDLKALAQEMERYAYSTDSAYTDNPAINPIRVVPDSSVKLHPFPAYKIHVPAGKTYVDISTREPGETIYVKLPADCLGPVCRSVPVELKDRRIIGSNITFIPEELEK